MRKFLSVKKRVMLCGLTALFAALNGIGKVNGKTGVCSGCASCNGSCAGARLSKAQFIQDKGYYETKKGEMMQEFAMHEPFIKQELSKRFNSKALGIVMNQIKKQYSDLIIKLPYIGGDKNSLTGNLVTCAVYLSAYKVLKWYKIPANSVGEMAYKITVKELTTFYSKDQMKKMGQEQFSNNYINGLKLAAKESQNKKYPYDWVYTVVDGDKKNFDYGIDYTECGIVKFFHQQKADELVPFMCKLDFAISDSFELGLKRSGTIADGKGKCDFRYKLVP